jgi:rod shape-determining protein MreC
VGLRKENKKLLDVATSQHTRIIAGEEALLENQRLQKLLELKGAMADRSLVAHVIGEDSAPWFKSIIIDRGADDGLREGMPVVATSGVVGQIVKVTGSKSRVLLLTDNASAIAGTVQRSRARGVVKGKGGGLCTLEFALREEDVQVGDVIITSGMGGVFPKGLPLGEVTMVKKGEYRIFQSVEVRPAVNLPRLEEVVVLLRQQTQEPL